MVAVAVVLLPVLLGGSDNGRSDRLEDEIAEARCPGNARPEVRCEPLDDGRYACVKSLPGLPDERLTVDDPEHFEVSLIC